jgi:spore coat polysaccharide biosynthesis predicted glycosyltransferase SpsG
MGHLYRGMNLGDALRDNGHQVCLVVNRDPGSIALIRDRGFDHDAVDTYLASGWEGEIIDRCNPHWWINDRLDTYESHGRTISAAGVRLATFDDHGGGAGMAEHDFLAMDPEPAEARPNGRYGPEYIVLNPSVAEFRLKRRGRLQGNGILVTMGGSDTYGVTPRVLKALECVERKMTVSVVTGPNFRHQRALADAVRVSCHSPAVFDRVENLIAMMAEAEIIICAGGVTLFEAAGLGLPAVAIANEPHEVPVVQWFARQGACIDGGFHRDDFSSRLPGLLTGLLDDPERRLRMGESGRSLVDLAGTGRIVSLLEAGR